MDTLALTDRDGAYGAVKFARACYAAGIRPVLGVELAHRPVLPTSAGPTAARTRTPVRGGAFREPVGGGLPRVTFLATADSAGGGRAGWAALCRLVSSTHLAGERGVPVLDPGTLPDDVRRALAAGHLLVLLGPASELARAALCSSGGAATTSAWPRWRPWRELVPAHPPAGRAGLPPAPGRWRRRRGVGAGHLAARRPDGRAGPAGRDRGGAEQRGALRRPRRRGHRRRPRRGPPAGGARPAARRPRQRRGLPQVRQGDGRDRRGGRPARRVRRARRVRARGAAAARPHPRGRRPVRPRPAPRPRPGRGALPGVRAVDGSRRR